MALRVAAGIFGTACLGFGVNAILRPRNALEFFEFDVPATTSDQNLVDYLMVVYGARDIFMGLGIYAATYFWHRQILGWLLVLTGGVAFADGAVCRANGHGEWNHWGYAPMVAGVGMLLLLGRGDRK